MSTLSSTTVAKQIIIISDLEPHIWDQKWHSASCAISMKKPQFKMEYEYYINIII